MSKTRLKVLIAQHRWWYPTSMSGADIANHEFAKRLKARGVDVRVHGIVAPDADNRTRQQDYIAEGIPVCLISSDFLRRLENTVQEFKPDVVLTSCPEPSCGADDISRMVKLFGQFDLPVVLYVHDIDGTIPLFKKVKNRLAAVVTNSKFMAGRVRDLWSVDCEVVYPVPDWKDVDTGGVTGPFVTFFNPLPHKGLNVAHTLVMKKFPERPFLFVEGFIDPEAHGIALSRSGNLVHARRSPNISTIYMMTRTLIVPSQWEEPFGRVALEAMYNRVPVIASKTGGLLESVGEGGILIDDGSNVDLWAQAIEFLDDPDKRQELIESGSRHVQKFSAREEMDKLMELLRRVAA